MDSAGNLAMAEWIMKDTDTAPDTAWIAIGINDCRRGHDGGDVADNIIKTIEIVKSYSPQTAIVWQKILPAADDDRGWVGNKWTDQDSYDCIAEANKKVEDWIDDNSDTCISIADFSDFVLDNGKFMSGRLGSDGFHFIDGGDMDGYCKLISEAVSEWKGNDVESRSDSSPWRDVEPLRFEGVGEAYYTWKYTDWDTCTGMCGTQMRTAECHYVNPNVTNTTVVPDSSCANEFMNPLERLCNLDDPCVSSLPAPPEALVHQPRTIVALSPAKSGQTGLASGLCSEQTPLSIGLMSAVAVLGALVLVLFGLVLYLLRRLNVARVPTSEDVAPSKASAQA